VVDIGTIARVPGAVGRDVAAAMEDAVWAALARRGIRRDAPGTWPAGLLGKHQGLRQARRFDAFQSPAVDALVDRLLGPGTWTCRQAWGPALVTFPQPGTWEVPHTVWHLDLPGRNHAGERVARLFGYVNDVGPRGGATLAVDGSHELVARMVAGAPGGDAGGSSQLRKRLCRHPWFRALCAEGGDDRVRRFMVDGDEIDGVRVRVVELTGEGGDVVAMPPWTLHNFSMNSAATPRFMVTQSIYRDDFRYERERRGTAPVLATPPSRPKPTAGSGGMSPSGRGQAMGVASLSMRSPTSMPPRSTQKWGNG
jgi:hypothetical protein